MRVVFVAVPNNSNARHVALSGPRQPDLTNVVETRRSRNGTEKKAIRTQIRDLERLEPVAPSHHPQPAAVLTDHGGTRRRIARFQVPGVEGLESCGAGFTDGGSRRGARFATGVRRRGHFGTRRRANGRPLRRLGDRKPGRQSEKQTEHHSHRAEAPCRGSRLPIREVPRPRHHGLVRIGRKQTPPTSRFRPTTTRRSTTPN